MVVKLFRRTVLVTSWIVHRTCNRFQRMHFEYELLFCVRCLRQMCISFAEMERMLGEIDRARGIYVYCSQICDPRVSAIYSPIGFAIWDCFRSERIQKPGLLYMFSETSSIIFCFRRLRRSSGILGWNLKGNMAMKIQCVKWCGSKEVSRLYSIHR